MESAILSLLRVVASDRRAMETDAIDERQLEWVVSTGLGPLLRYYRGGGSTILPAGFDESLLRSELQAKINSKLQRGAMASIIERCDGKTVGPFTLLKGISICEQYYPEPHLRPMADIDFLVDRRDVATVESALVDLGYRQSSHRPASFYETHHHTMPFTHPRTRVRVEVHTGLLPPESELSRSEVFSPRQVEMEAQPSTFAGHPVLRLSDELQLLFIASDTRWERWIFGSPIPLVDILFLLQGAGPGFAWERILAWMSDSRLAVHVGLVLTFLARYGLVEAPPEMTKALRGATRRTGRVALRVLHREIERHSLMGQPLEDRLGFENRRIVWETLLSDRSPGVKLLLAPWNVAFPPGHPERFDPRLALRRLQSVLRSRGYSPFSD